jgi:hypothetical protein
MPLVPELELTRSRDDRRTYVLEEVGAVRVGGWLGGPAEIDVVGERWEVRRRGILRRVTEATDAAGAVVGRFGPQGWRRGGPLWWNGRDLALEPSSAWRERYALTEGERELASLEGKGWGSRPVRIAVADLAAVDPALLLFAALVVRSLAEDAGGSSAATTSAATAG